MFMSSRKKFFLIFVPSAIVLGVIVLAVSASNFVREKPGCRCENIDQATGDFSPEEKAYFEDKEVKPPLAVLPTLPANEIKVLGETSGAEKWIEVDLSEQKIRAWEGNHLFLESLVSTGKWGRTPTGEYRIWGKFKYAKMSGGSQALHTYYYLPNVPYIMYYQNGFSLHGTYWHNNFGQTMSHGCTNLPTPVAEKLFYWTTPTVPSGVNAVRATADDPGTRIVVHE
jgi:lipoprotein-anchoring transpeptidase ErfK/SrfK